MSGDLRQLAQWVAGALQRWQEGQPAMGGAAQPGEQREVRRTEGAGGSGEVGPEHHAHEPRHSPRPLSPAAARPRHSPRDLAEARAKKRPKAASDQGGNSARTQLDGLGGAEGAAEAEDSEAGSGGERTATWAGMESQMAEMERQMAAMESEQEGRLGQDRRAWTEDGRRTVDARAAMESEQEGTAGSGEVGLEPHAHDLRSTIRQHLRLQQSSADARRARDLSVARKGKRPKTTSDQGGTSARPQLDGPGQLEGAAEAGDSETGSGGVRSEADLARTGTEAWTEAVQDWSAEMDTEQSALRRDRRAWTERMLAAAWDSLSEQAALGLAEPEVEDGGDHEPVHETGLLAHSTDEDGPELDPEEYPSDGSRQLSETDSEGGHADPEADDPSRSPTVVDISTTTSDDSGAGERACAYSRLAAHGSLPHDYYLSGQYADELYRAEGAADDYTSGRYADALYRVEAEAARRFVEAGQAGGLLAEPAPAVIGEGERTVEEADEGKDDDREEHDDSESAPAAPAEGTGVDEEQDGERHDDRVEDGDEEEDDDEERDDDGGELWAGDLRRWAPRTFAARGAAVPGGMQHTQPTQGSRLPSVTLPLADAGPSEAPLNMGATSASSSVRRSLRLQGRQPELEEGANEDDEREDGGDEEAAAVARPCNCPWFGPSHCAHPSCRGLVRPPPLPPPAPRVFAARGAEPPGRMQRAQPVPSGTSRIGYPAVQAVRRSYRLRGIPAPTEATARAMQLWWTEEPRTSGEEDSDEDPEIRR